MSDIEHVTIVDGERHEPKGVDGATPGQVLTCQTPGVSFWSNVSGGGGGGTFLSLTDTPSNYISSANKVVRVNDAGSGLEFRDSSASSKVSDAVVASSFETSLSVGFTYVPGSLDMFVNGVKLARTIDFTATDGTSVQLVEGVDVGDVYWFETVEEVVKYTNVANIGEHQDITPGYGIAGQIMVTNGVDGYTYQTPNTYFNKLDATTAPTVTNDSDEGFQVGSFWIDTTNSESYRCADDAVGAAVWLHTTVDTGELDSVYLKLTGGTLTNNLTVQGDLVVNGAFTSLGIDDNATGERLQLQDNTMNVGGPGAFFRIERSVNDQSLTLKGGANTGGALTLFGSAHATQANDIELLSTGDVVELHFDKSLTTWDFQANDIITTGEVDIGGSGTDGVLRLKESDSSSGALINMNTGTFNLIHEGTSGNVSIGFGGANSTGSLVFKSAGFVTALTIDSTGTANFQANDITTTGSITRSAEDVITNDDSETGTAVTKIWTGTQVQYDAITTKSATTVYLVE